VPPARQRRHGRIGQRHVAAHAGKGSIADINAYLFNGNLLWNPDGANNHEMGLLKIEIDDNGCLPGGNVVCSTVLISEICNPDFSCSSVNDLLAGEFHQYLPTSMPGRQRRDHDLVQPPRAPPTTYDGGPGNGQPSTCCSRAGPARGNPPPTRRCPVRSPLLRQRSLR